MCLIIVWSCIGKGKRNGPLDRPTERPTDRPPGDSYIPPKLRFGGIISYTQLTFVKTSLSKDFVINSIIIIIIIMSKQVKSITCNSNTAIMCQLDIFVYKLLLHWGVNVKWFYLLLYSIVLIESFDPFTFTFQRICLLTYICTCPEFNHLTL